MTIRAEEDRLSLIGVETTFSEESFNTTKVFSRIGLDDKWAIDLEGSSGKDDSEQRLIGLLLGANYQSNFGLDSSFYFGKQEDEQNVDIRSISFGLGHSIDLIDLDFFQTRFFINFNGNRYKQELGGLLPNPITRQDTFSERQFSLGIGQELSEYFSLSLSYSFFSHSEDVNLLNQGLRRDLPFPEMFNLLGDFLDNATSASLGMSPLSWFYLNIGVTQTVAVLENNKTLILDITPELVLYEDITLGVNYVLSKGDFSEKSEQYSISLEYLF